MAECWTYAHVDLGEPHFPDGSIVRRPVVAVAPVNSAQILLAVVDSGSPISVADARLFQRSGIDTERDKPIYDVPLTIGGGDGLTRSRPPSQSAQIGSVRRSPTVFGGVVGRDLCHRWRDIDPNEAGRARFLPPVA